MSFPPDPKPSAVVILHRPGGEVYLVKRPKTASFFPGFLAFPGGGVEDEDARDDDVATLKACGARELAEETTVQVDPDALDPAGVVVTPPFSPIRYRTQFLLYEAPEDLEPDPQAPELAGGTWMDPGEAIERWKAGEVKLPPPVIHTLELLADDGPDAIRSRGTSVDTFPITFLPGLRVEPLEVRTLPPHTHTNAFLVGEDRLAIVDPGAASPELDPLEATLDQLAVEGENLAYVVLTHHHEDHVAGARELVESYDPELACSRETADRIDLDADVLLEQGDVLDLDEHRLIAHETPGHAPGHLVFEVPKARTLLAGDLVAGVGTVLIPPDEGDMAAYMDSLDRMATLCETNELRLAFPAHGPPQFGPAGKLRDTLEHRRMREERVLDALTEAPAELSTIAKRAYEDKPDAPEPLKRMSTRAHLDKLADEGRAREAGTDRWQRA